MKSFLKLIFKYLFYNEDVENEPQKEDKVYFGDIV